MRLKVQAVGLNRAELIFMREQYVDDSLVLDERLRHARC
jgi:hypothetical protein